MSMSKRTVFTTISPLPPGIPREVVLSFLHSHIEMIDLNPLVKERHPIPAPPHAAPEEGACVWYSLTDKISYLPGGLATGNVSYTCAFNDLPTGLQTHCYAPMGLDIRDKWTLGGSLPGEPPAPVELGLNAPATGLYIREDVDMRCNIMMAGFVKKTLKKAHASLVEHLKVKASIVTAVDGVDEPQQQPPSLQHSNSWSLGQGDPRNQFSGPADKQSHHFYPPPQQQQQQQPFNPQAYDQRPPSTGPSPFQQGGQNGGAPYGGPPPYQNQSQHQNQHQHQHQQQYHPQQPQPYANFQRGPSPHRSPELHHQRPAQNSPPYPMSAVPNRSSTPSSRDDHPYANSTSGSTNPYMSSSSTLNDQAAYPGPLNVGRPASGGRQPQPSWADKPLPYPGDDRPDARPTDYSEFTKNPYRDGPSVRQRPSEMAKENSYGGMPPPPSQMQQQQQQQQQQGGWGQRQGGGYYAELE